MTRREMLALAALTLTFVYLLVSGGTFNGILTAGQRTTTLLMMTGGAFVWAFLRWRSRKPWALPPLLGAIMLWVLAFAVSLLANAESWRRISISLWYAGLYIALWLILCDALANRLLHRETLLNALLIAGVVVVLLGYLQVSNALRAGLPLPRPVSSLGNPNTLAALLVMLLPLILGGLLTAKNGLLRLLLGVYALAAGGLLLLTFSRAGWIGGAAGVLALGAGWLLSSRDRLERLKARWLRLSFAVRVGAVVAVGGTLLVGGLLFAQTFNQPGRSLDLRTFIYDTAIRAFLDKPLTGEGLFTFGRLLARYNPTPPYEPHSHAHSIALNTAAELGIVGLAASGLTAILVGRALVRGLRDAQRMAGAAAVCAFGVHHLLDLPAMMPIIAVIALVALAVVMTPDSPHPNPSPSGRGAKAQTAAPITQARGVRTRLLFSPLPGELRSYGEGQGVRAATLLLIGALILSGWWSANLYTRYVAILTDASRGNYREGAQTMGALIDADPAMPIYHYEQGFLWGLADDPAAAITAFERFTALEPDYAIGWANLSALYEAAGDIDAALTAAKRASAAANDPTFAYNLGRLAEAAGDIETARAAYLTAVESGTDLAAAPGWCASALRCSLDVPLSPAAEALRLLETGDNAAAERWRTVSAERPLTAREYIVDLIFALSEKDEDRAASALGNARAITGTPLEGAWLHVGEARLAAYRGDTARAASEIEAARALLTLDPFESDWELGANIFYIQYLHLAIPRLFLPQVGFPLQDGLLLRLLDGGT